ncbi:hypothetical protein CFT12S00416_07920 [Campylobacter fetus subsp. testudinum]|uniref:type IV secretory system conjugative DNA transfer family protein n=1 Tax=Campylobacter fetus TaxID=196 RepID=UPI000818AC9D|nr:type IV secretory system conjugative DNA transfer family protein [Campylobacter fetus]OCR87744.1 hypothetical protein CFT12S00416_07920 [Campylobacter fetus subsp. testudinum]OCR98914.1 hypothetical protein A9K75_09340 [Campylobacter fetus subsp. testudinum]
MKFEKNQNKENIMQKIDINHETGLILGCSDMDPENPKFLRATSPSPTLVVGSIGSGKTSGIIIPNLLSVPNSSVILDIKGELYEKTAGYRQKFLKNEIRIIDFENEANLDFNFDDLLKKQISLYIVAKIENLQYQAPLIGNFIKTLFKTLNKKENLDPNKIVYCYLDEFFCLRNSNMQSLITGSTFFKNSALLPVLTAQSYDQISGIYNNKTMDIIKNNMEYQVVILKDSYISIFVKEYGEIPISSFKLPFWFRINKWKEVNKVKS